MSFEVERGINSEQKYSPVLISKINPSTRTRLELVESQARPFYAGLSFTENNPSLAHIVRRDLDFHFVARDNTNKILPHFSTDMGENLLAVWQRHPKHRIG
jgi:hypothetical protein